MYLFMIVWRHSLPVSSDKRFEVVYDKRQVKRTTKIAIKNLKRARNAEVLTIHVNMVISVSNLVLSFLSAEV